MSAPALWHSLQRSGTAAPGGALAVQRVTSRQAPWREVRQPTPRTAGEPVLLDRRRQAYPALAQDSGLAQDWARSSRAQQPGTLEGWWQAKARSALGAFQRLAKSCQRNDAAVQAGVTLSWSTGPVEGEINRLKMRKRQMFGRAKIALLALQMLLVAERSTKGGHEPPSTGIRIGVAQPTCDDAGSINVTPKST